MKINLLYILLLLALPVHAATVIVDGSGVITSPAPATFKTANGLALTANPLSQFASTTSAQFFGVLSDETGSSSGALAVFNINPTLAGATFTGNLLFTDNTYDIGASGATRPRTIYTGTSMVTPAITISGLTSGRVPFVTTGGLLTDASTLTFSAGTLSATTFSGAFSGTATAASTVSTSNEASDTSCFLAFFTTSGTQVLEPKNNTGLTYNSSTNSLVATNFVGALTGNATTATALANTRAIYGNNFDGSAALTQVIASTYGGTGNGFLKFSGPTTSEKTWSGPDASATILTDNAQVTVAQGGTGRATGTTAYSLVATGTTATGAQQTLANGAATEILVGGGASALPVWTTASGTGAPARVGSPTFTGTVGAAAISATGTITDTQLALGGTLPLVATTTGVGLLQTNTTAATNGAQQVSGVIRQIGTGFMSNSSQSESNGFQFGVIPIQGTSVSTATWVVQASINGGAYSDKLTLFSSGQLNLSGAFVSGGNINLPAANSIFWTTRGLIKSPADSILCITNNAETDFNRLQLGGTSSSFPAIKRNGTSVECRLADDSATTGLICGNISGGSYSMSTNSDLAWGGRCHLYSNATNGMYVTDTAQTGFGVFAFGGTTSSFPAIKRNSTAINFRLADDSADAAITSGAITSTGALVIEGAFRTSSVNISDFQVLNATNFGTASTACSIGGVATDARVVFNGNASNNSGNANRNVGCVIIGNQTIDEASSGTHPILSQLAVRAATITAGAATVTDTATVYIEAAASATVTGGNHALFVDSGSSRFDGVIGGSDGSASLPGYSFTSDLDSGIYSVAANEIGFATNGAQVFGADATGFYLGTTASKGRLAITGGQTLTVTTGGTIASGSAAYKATGTSGNTIPLLDGGNTWSGVQRLGSNRVDYVSSSVGNVGAGVDTLWSVNVVGNTLTNAGESLEWVASGTFANNANTKNIVISFGGNTIFTTGAIAAVLGDWTARGSIVKVGSGARSTTTIVTSAAVLTATADEVNFSITLSSDQTFLITGEATLDNDVTIQMGKITLQ